LGREKTAMATAVTSATWRNSACCRRRNNHHFTHGYANIMLFNVYNFGYIWFGVRAQNLLRWMAVENRCGLGVRRVYKYFQSHIWTEDGRTLGRGIMTHFWGYRTAKTFSLISTQAQQRAKTRTLRGKV
jgi:hypothetical protein